MIVHQHQLTSALTPCCPVLPVLLMKRCFILEGAIWKSHVFRLFKSSINFHNQSTWPELRRFTMLSLMPNFIETWVVVYIVSVIIPGCTELAIISRALWQSSIRSDTRLNVKHDVDISAILGKTLDVFLHRASHHFLLVSAWMSLKHIDNFPVIHFMPHLIKLSDSMERLQRHAASEMAIMHNWAQLNCVITSIKDCFYGPWEVICFTISLPVAFNLVKIEQKKNSLLSLPRPNFWLSTMSTANGQSIAVCGNIFR